MRKLLVTSAVAALIGAGGMIAFTAPASAYVVCNRKHDCWHTTEHYDYRPGFGLTVHPDDWKWGKGNWRWREHDGRGYWRGDTWITF